jgi:TonB family protein
MVMPVYPERALRERVRGLVVLKVLVAEDGSPVRITVEKAAREDLTRVAIEAANQWRFEPARKNGRPVRTFTTLRFPFEGIQFARTPFEQSESSSAPQLTATPTLPPARSEEEWRERTPRPSPNWRERTRRPTLGPGDSRAR